MRRQERRGMNNIESRAKPQRAKKLLNYIRLYYRNEDNELLCADTEPMTGYMAQKFADEWRKGYYAFDFVEMLEVGRNPAPQCNARLVVFPSQLPLHAQSDFHEDTDGVD